MTINLNNSLTFLDIVILNSVMNWWNMLGIIWSSHKSLSVSKGKWLYVLDKIGRQMQYICKNMPMYAYKDLLVVSHQHCIITVCWRNSYDMALKRNVYTRYDEYEHWWCLSWLYFTECWSSTHLMVLNIMKSEVIFIFH